MKSDQHFPNKVARILLEQLLSESREPKQPPRKQEQMKKSKAQRVGAIGFVIGAVAGALVATRWRELLKGTVKAGIQAGDKLREVSQKAREELEDVAAEVDEELRAKSGHDQADA